MGKLIYVADDEKNIRELIKSFLEEEGFTVEVFESGDRLLEKFNEKAPDMAIIDVMMPGTDGFSTCAAIRKKSDLPVIMLTARDTDADYITGFTLGCDDYFTKPFSPVKLIMRVKAFFKRLDRKEETKESKDELEFLDIIISPQAKTAHCKEKEMKLTNTEFLLLTYLVKNREKAVSRDELLSAVWGYDAETETRVTDDIVRRLRKKLNEFGSDMEIETVWGFGFKIGEKK